jgi:hypothetical protein
MHIRRILGLALIGILLTGCRVGGWNRGQEVTPFGGTVSLTAAAVTMQGELLLADETGVLALVGNEILRAPWSAISRIQVRDRPASVALSGNTPTEADLDALRLASRYPFGITDDQLASLLEAHGQSEVRVVR